MHGLEGLKHMASSIVPGIYHEHELDDENRRSAPKTPTTWSTRSGRRGHPGRPVVGRRDDRGAASSRARFARARIVTIFADFGDKYLSTNLWIGWQEWRRERLQQVIAKWKNK